MAKVTTDSGMVREEAALPSGEWIVAEYGVRGAYFSVTGMVFSSKAVARRWPEHPHTCGCIHDLILAAFPHLADLVALHLADANGMPMHAASNGWFWYSDGAGRDVWYVYGEFASLSPLERAASVLRVDASELPAGLSRAGFFAFVEGLGERWQAEADAAIARHELTVG